MTIKTKVKTIITASGQTYRSVAPAFDLTEAAAATKLGRGLHSIEDLIKLCDYCKATITITLSDGTVIKLTKDDI